MRIIAGAARGRRILSIPKAMPVRPISSRIRQSLFDILRSRTPGSRFLDLFAGTGAVGLEALSRGAEHAVFVDGDRRCVEVIEKNLERAGWLLRPSGARLPGSARKASLPAPALDCVSPIPSSEAQKRPQSSRLGSVFHGDILQPLSWIAYRSGVQCFDLVFMGPPYKDKSAHPLRVVSVVAKQILAAGLLEPKGWLVAQHHKSEMPEVPLGLELFRRTRYGDTLVSFFRRS